MEVSSGSEGKASLADVKCVEWKVETNDLNSELDKHILLAGLEARKRNLVTEAKSSRPSEKKRKSSLSGSDRKHDG